MVMTAQPSQSEPAIYEDGLYDEIIQDMALMEEITQITESKSGQDGIH